MSRPERIVITGMGLVTSLGASPGEVWARVLEGRCGVGPMPALEQRPEPDKGGGQAVALPGDPDAERTDPGWPRPARYLRYAVRQALADAGGAPGEPRRRAVCVGTTLHGMPAGGRFVRTGDPRELDGFLAGPVLRRALGGLGLDGANLTTCSACSSGLASVAMARTLLLAGEADVVVAGGYDCVSEYVYAGFDSLRLIAAGPPRPFADGRDGMKVAEGYAALVMEREADALRRGARVLAVVAGVGESADAFHLTQPRPDGWGAAVALRAALAQAGARPEEVDLVAAHATATANNDAAEYAALAGVFGDGLARVPVAAFKSHLGHTLGGAGAVELILSALCHAHGRVPPLAHGSPIDPAFVGLRVVRESLSAPVHTSVNLSLGFGGSNACVVLSDRGVPAASARAADDVVITGVGVVVPGAVGNGAFVELLNRESAGDPAGGPIDDAALAGLAAARRARRISGYSRLTLAATSVACEDAGVLENAAWLSGCAALLGTTHGSSPYCEAYYGQIVREGMGAANPVLFAEGVPNAAAAQLSLMFGLTGSCQTVIGTRTAGLDALRLAALRIREGAADRVLVSAAEEHSAVVERAYGACGLFDDGRAPLTASGAVTLVLERRSAAEAREARVRAVVGEGGAASGPDAAAALRSAIEGAGGPAGLLSAWTAARPDRATLAAIGPEARAGHWSVHGRVPELFSAGPLAALAAWLLWPAGASGGPPGGPEVVMVATEFAGGATAVRVRRGPS